MDQHPIQKGVVTKKCNLFTYGTLTYCKSTLGNLFNACRTFHMVLEFGYVGFFGEEKTRVPREKPLGAKERTNNKLSSTQI